MQVLCEVGVPVANGEIVGGVPFPRFGEQAGVVFLDQQLQQLQLPPARRDQRWGEEVGVRALDIGTALQRLADDGPKIDTTDETDEANERNETDERRQMGSLKGHLHRERNVYMFGEDTYVHERHMYMNDI